MPKKKTINEVKKAFEQNGYELLETEYKNSHTPMHFKCPKHPNEETKVCYSSLMSGTRCRFCSNTKKGSHKKLNNEYVEKRFKQRGYTLLEEYKNSRTKIKYRCLKHPDKLLSIRYNDFQSGHGCPYCSGKLSKLTIEFVREEFKKRNYKLLETEYRNVDTKMRYECPFHPDEEIRIRYHDFQNGAGCPFCATERRSEIIRGENHYNWKGGITELKDFLRKHISEWKQDSLKIYGYKCFVTQGKQALEIHHVTPFYKIRDLVLEELNMPVFKNVSDYSEEQLNLIIEKLKEHHDEIGGVPLESDVHRLFHKIYGVYDTTIEQLHEFKYRYLSGEFTQENTLW